MFEVLVLLENHLGHRARVQGLGQVRPHTIGMLVQGVERVSLFDVVAHYSDEGLGETEIGGHFDARQGPESEARVGDLTADEFRELTLNDVSYAVGSSCHLVVVLVGALLVGAHEGHPDRGE